MKVFIRSCWIVSQTENNKEKKQETQQEKMRRQAKEKGNRNTPASVMMEDNFSEKKVERQKVSLDIRKDLYKQVKMQSVLEDDKKIYNIIEEALDYYFNSKK